MVKLTILKYTEEEAVSMILNHLRDSGRDRVKFPDYGNDLYIPNVIDSCAEERKLQWSKENPNPVYPITWEYDSQTNSSSFYDAAWSLCIRGILRPTVINPKQLQQQQTGIIGAGFNLTPYGKHWLENTSGYECIPSEYGRFSQLLAEYSHRFRDGYHIRSQEAVSCYRAHNYLACCVMCGAASESVLLALAIAKNGNEEAVLTLYKTGSGRSKIENLLLHQQNPYICKELPKYTDLLKYWRDNAAHGADTNIGENEAFISLLLLLRFAKFGHEEWDNLTNSNSPS